jgi:undecaprenyl-diphosphatase
MSELTHYPVSGAPESSLSARRLQPRPDSSAEWLGRRLRWLPSLLVTWIVANAGALVIAAFMVGLGFLTMKVLLSIGWVAHIDDRVPEWLAAHRTPSRTHWAHIGSMLGDFPVLVPLVGLVSFVLVLGRRWRTASFVIQAGTVELLAYGVTVTFVLRARPHVAHLGNAPANHSFPSGHVAASIAVWGALALLLTAHFKGRWARAGIWIPAIVIPVIVATARLYQGEHHPTDVAAGALMGVAALLAALFAARTGRSVAELRAAKHGAAQTAMTGERA